MLELLRLVQFYLLPFITFPFITLRYELPKW